jgi:phospholipase C
MLPMYKYLAAEFCICDRFFSSHPGPTMPNRMFSLSGQLQYDRFGEPRFNNGGDSLTLSRDPTIFDLLSQHGITWRVYESPPSVTMLRFFSRYAGNDTEIRDVNFLQYDVQNGKLPSVTFIDPQFHYSRPNDDHPPADMMAGQNLIGRVYKALRSKQSVWEKTLFIVTYDEHGGLFDHVVPDVAEILQDGSKPPVEVRYGVRVPSFLVSPWVEKGSVFKQVVDHTSILKTILVRFCGAQKPHLSDRVTWASDLGAALTLSQSRTIQETFPTLPPDPSADIPGGVFTTSPSGSPAMSMLAGPPTMPVLRKDRLLRDDADWHEFMQALAQNILS